MALQPRAATLREVFAPPPTDPSLSNRIDSVLLRPNERVTWEWTEVGFGRAFVSGFRIARAWRRPPPPPSRPGRSSRPPT